jgi:ABC-type transport system involved in multi-copper enzyme maturation permease subunit
MKETSYRRLPFRPVFAIAWVTFLEIIFDKILYNFILFAFLLIGVSYLASQLTFLSQDRVILDFGMSAINLSCGIIGVFAGAAMFAREFERRTIFVALARPISRIQFVTGKFIGLAGVLILNWLFLTLTEILLFVTLGGMLKPVTVVALAFLGLQSLVLAAFAVFFSSFTTTSISVMMVIGLYLIGNNVDALRIVLEKSKEPWVKEFVLPAANLIPNLSHFNLGLTATYGIPIGSEFIWSSIGYAFLWIIPLIYLTGHLLDRREG